MSYIRSTSNNEHIYIFDSGNYTQLLKSHNEHYELPHNIFVNIIRKYILDSGCKESYKYKGASLIFHYENNECLWHLKYKDFDFSFPHTILDYIVHNNAYIFCNKKEYMEFACFCKFKFSAWNKK